MEIPGSAVVILQRNACARRSGFVNGINDHQVAATEFATHYRFFIIHYTIGKIVHLYSLLIKRCILKRTAAGFYYQPPVGKCMLFKMDPSFGACCLEIVASLLIACLEGSGG